ncbi:hypothetical protein K492DRAFT_191695 [Lichtheimia hyalospora FSU 10163]|nr:hypothetical protein K492DRAFT_191695 [Lichtheimia hyalospora FSU 10163]
MSLNEDSTVQLGPLSSQSRNTQSFSRLFNGWASVRDLECCNSQLEQRRQLLENLNESHSLSTSKLLHKKVQDAQEDMDSATSSMETMHEEEARSFSEIIRAMVSLIAEQDTKAIYAPLFSDLEEKGKTTLDTIQQHKDDISQSISQLREQLIQSHYLRMTSEARMEKLEHELCRVEFPQNAKHIYTIQQHRIKQGKQEWDALVNDAKNTAMDNVIQQGVLHALLHTHSHHIPAYISNSLKSIMQHYIQRVEKAEHIYKLFQSFNDLWPTIQRLNTTLEEHKERQQVKERIAKEITLVETSIFILKDCICQFVIRNDGRLAKCIAIQTLNLEEEMDLIEQHLNQFKTNVLHPGIGERLHTILKNFNLVLRNHADFLRYILDADAAAQDRALTYDDVVAVCKAPISQPMEKMIEQLAEDAISTSLRPLIDKMDQLENLL